MARRDALKKERRREQRRKSATAAGKPPTRPDATASPEIRAAMLQTDRLLRLVTFPIHVRSSVMPEPRVLYNWDLVAPAMLFSAANCLLSIRLLAEVQAPRREQDASVLLRRLYEHVVDFAWIAIDSEKHAKQWVSDDYFYRLKFDDEMKLLGKPGLAAAMRADFDLHIKTYGRMPDVASRADAADKHWSKRVSGHGVFPSTARPLGQPLTVAQSGNWSLRTLYAVIYRSASAKAHPTAFSLFIDSTRPERSRPLHLPVQHGGTHAGSCGLAPDRGAVRLTTLGPYRRKGTEIAILPALARNRHPHPHAAPQSRSAPRLRWPSFRKSDGSTADALRAFGTSLHFMQRWHRSRHHHLPINLSIHIR